MSLTASGSRFHQRLIGRAVIYIILPFIIGSAVIVTVNTRRNFSNLRRASEKQMATEAAVAARRISAASRTAILAAQCMAEAQVAGMFGNRQASLDYARLILEGSPEFTAAYFCYELDADGKDAESGGVLPQESMDASGRFIPYWFVATSKGGGVDLEPAVDMDTSLYYKGAKDAFATTGKPQPMVTEPYVYRGKMIVEQTYPIVIDGRFKGVAGVDRALTDVESALGELASKLDADAFLISSRDKFIAATTDAERESGAGLGGLQTKAVADTVYAGLFGRLAAQIKSRTLGLVEVAEDPTDAARYYFAADYIRTGGWTLIVRKPVNEILAPAWEQAQKAVIAAVGFLLFVTLLLVVGVVNVSRKINVAVKAANLVAHGDLTQDVDPGRSNDETGVLLQALKKMTQNLNSLVSSVRQASIQMNSTATELAATSREQESTASNFGASSSQIAAAVKQISATGNELVQTMCEVHKVATETAGLATTGQDSLQQMEATMLELDEATGSIAEKLGVINEKTSNITGMVTTITKVAEQTNLLSVNAAIEAEKAGEYGVGFLVVAREIRRLADQTAGATLDIERMVQQMQSAVSTGVMEMDRFSDQVRRSVKDVAEISQRMASIIERVNASTESFERVNEGMQSQSQGADQISEAMGQLTTNATHTMQSIQEYGHAANDLQGAIASLKSSIASFELK